ncbi:MAG TPA: nitroreductase [Acidimicrobiales bacterium]
MDRDDDGTGDGGADGTTSVPPADPTWVGRLSAVRPEPDSDGQVPEPGDLERILATATTVPDHGGLEPWRFAVCTGTGRDRLADALVAGLHEAQGFDLPDAVVAKMRGKAYAAPCSVVLIASPDPTSNVEVWEQVASASCTGYAVVLAATGLGYGAVWKSAGVLGTGPVRTLFGLTEHESLLGWVNLGTPAPLGRKKSAVAPTVDPLDGRVLRLDA